MHLTMNNSLSFISPNIERVLGVDTISDLAGDVGRETMSDAGLAGVVPCLTDDAAAETVEELALRARRTWIAAALPSWRW